MMKTYRGNTQEITLNGERLALRNHPHNDLLADQFGEKTFESRDLAYSILADALGEDAAHLLSEDFRQSIVEKLDPDHWEVTDEDVKAYSQYFCAAGYEAQQSWEDVGSGRSKISTLPAFPKIVLDPNYRLRKASAT